MTAGGTFEPPLGSTTYLGAANDNDGAGSRIWFSYLPADRDELGARVPEVWTNLPLSSSSSPPPTAATANDDEWHAVRLVPHSAELYTASIVLPAREGTWQFTYRFRSPNDDDEAGVEWVGSAEANGRVVVVAGGGGDGKEWAGPDGAGWTAFEDGTGRVKVGAFGRPVGAGEDREWDVVLESEWVVPVVWGDRDVDGIVIEQSSRTWFAPRPLPRSSGSAVLRSISPTFPAQLVVLRFLPCATDPRTRYTVLFPFSTRHVCSALVGDGLRLRCQADAPSGTVEAEKGHLAVAWGEEGELQALIERCVAAARSVVTRSPPSAHVAATSTPLFPPKALGVCTWNALSLGGSRDYSASAVLSWLESLQHRSSPGAGAGAATAIKTLLLDDGWQDTETYVDFSVASDDREHGERRALKGFQCSMEWFDLDDEDGGGADPSEGGSAEVGTARRQPREGVCVELREAVRRIKARGVEKVGVWLTLCGYWDGLHPDRSLADAYTLRRFTVRSAAHPSYSGHIYLPVRSDLRTFYDDYFSSLGAAGIDFVKVDDQATVDCLVAQEVGEDEEEGATPDDVGEYRVAMLEAMSAAAVDAFGADGIIHCMAGSPRIWGGSLGAAGATGHGTVRSTVRNSDDFFPDAPDSHRWHIALNALTTVLSSALRFEPDFDMAQAAHEFGAAHVALRAFSSAQVWSSDEPGADLGGWAPLLAMTKCGMRVLQAREGAFGTVLEGRVGDDVLGRPDGIRIAALKVGLPVASAQGAHIGVWNCLPADRLIKGRLPTIVDTKDVADSLRLVAGHEAKSFVLVDPDTLSATEVDSKIVDRAQNSPRILAKPLASVRVAEREANVLTVARVFDMPAAKSAKSVKIACLGLLDKTVGLAAIRSVKVVSGKEAQAQSRGRNGKDTGLSSSEALLSTASSSSTVQASGSGPNQTLTRPLSPTDPSTLPVPQGRVPFLLAYFAGFFRSSIVPNSSTGSSASRTPRTELQSLARDLLRRPIRTTLFELRTLVSFSIFTVFWIVGWRSNGGARTIEASPGPAQQTAEPVRSSEPETRLRVELDYLSDRLAVYVSPPPASLSSLCLFLDGNRVDASVLHSTSSDSGIVEFQVESAWKRSRSSQTASSGDGGGGESGRAQVETPWVVEVCFAR